MSSYPQWDFAGSQYIAISGTAGDFTTNPVEGRTYRFTANVNCWLRLGGTDAAADTAANMLYIAGQELFISPDATGALSVISDGTDGDGTLTPIMGD